MLNPVKFHVLNLLSHNDSFISKDVMVKRMTQMFLSMPECDVPKEIERLLETNQIFIDEDNFLAMGNVIFEEGVKVTVRAERAAKQILKNLKGRRGIGNEIETFDSDVIEELINTIASIIDKNRK